LKDLQPLQNLKTLLLVNTPLTDAGLKHVAQFKNLQRLNCAMARVTDTGVQQLGSV
jgi:hypothetical protein